jgi:hypothetical protein
VLSSLPVMCSHGYPRTHAIIQRFSAYKRSHLGQHRVYLRMHVPATQPRSSTLCDTYSTSPVGLYSHASDRHGLRRHIGLNWDRPSRPWLHREARLGRRHTSLTLATPDEVADDAPQVMEALDWVRSGRPLYPYLPP